MLLHFIFLIYFTYTHTETIFVFEQFRHGARGSAFISRNFHDKFDVEWVGDGELTGVGMRMHYLIGVHSREKYPNLLSKHLNPKEIIVYSTDLNRTILSAQSQLLGMFPPEKGHHLDYWDFKHAVPPNPLYKETMDEIERLGDISIPKKIEVIPVNLFDHDNKPYLLTEEAECPRMGVVKKENFKKKVVQDSIKEFNKTYGEKLMNYFKINNENFLFDYYTMLGITDHFISGYVHRRNLHSFYKYGIEADDFFEDCKKFKNLTFYEIESPEEEGIMAISPTIRDMIRLMDKSIQRDIDNTTTSDNNIKFAMYSGHDLTIAPMEQFLHKGFGVPRHYPDFACNQFFELHKGIKNNTNYYYVEYYYNGEFLLNISYTEFRTKCLSMVWPMDKILAFCRVRHTSFFNLIIYICVAISIIYILYIIMNRAKIDNKGSLRDDDKEMELVNDEEMEDNINPEEKNIANKGNQNADVL
jgi:hypothetical protein